MPRRDTYLTDDDDTPRRAAASGGGVPGWVWAAGGAVVFVVLLVGSFAVAFFNRREAMRQEVARADMMRHEVARADMMRAEAKARRAVVVGAEPVPGGMAGPGGPLPVIPLAQFANGYKTGWVAADFDNHGKRFRVRVPVQTGGKGWVGTYADLGRVDPGGIRPNVFFYFDNDPPAPVVPPVAAETPEVGELVVIEGTCSGLVTSNETPVGMKLVFNKCRVVRE